MRKSAVGTKKPFDSVLQRQCRVSQPLTAEREAPRCLFIIVFVGSFSLSRTRPGNPSSMRTKDGMDTRVATTVLVPWSGILRSTVVGLRARPTPTASVCVCYPLQSIYYSLLEILSAPFVLFYPPCIGSGNKETGCLRRSQLPHTTGPTTSYCQPSPLALGLSPAHR